MTKIRYLQCTYIPKPKSTRTSFNYVYEGTNTVIQRESHNICSSEKGSYHWIKVQPNPNKDIDKFEVEVMPRSQKKWITGSIAISNR